MKRPKEKNAKLKGLVGVYVEIGNNLSPRQRRAWNNRQRTAINLLDEIGILAEQEPGSQRLQEAVRELAKLIHCLPIFLSKQSFLFGELEEDK